MGQAVSSQATAFFAELEREFRWDGIGGAQAGRARPRRLPGGA